VAEDHDPARTDKGPASGNGAARTVSGPARTR
jgi:hypothetical protein